MAGYNRTRYVEELLESTEALPPSFAVHLHLEYWTLNNGSKFLYNNQIASLLDDVRAHRIPVDFLELFEAARVPFYDGCMIVELLDYRPQRNKEPTLEKPERTRAVLHPNSETLWADICSLNQRHGGKWSDTETLNIEARLLLATSPPLCLDPDPHLTRIANHVLRVSTPTVPVSLKRKATVLDAEEDETDKARRAKIMQYMNPRQNRAHTPSYRILDAIQAHRTGATSQPTPVSNQFMSNSASSPAKPPTPSINISQADSPVDSEDKKVKTKKETPQMSFATTAFTRANGSQTPVPQQATHHFISQNPNHPSPSSAHSPMQPQVYPNVQAATEAAKRTPTPAQTKHYSQSPRPAPSQPTSIPQNVSQPQNAPFQPSVPNSHFLSAPPARNGVSKVTSQNNTQSVPHPQQAQIQAQIKYAQQQQANAMLQQRLNGGQKNGRSTPQTTAGQSAPSSSPMVTNKPLAARSPMPPTSQLPTQQPQQPQGMPQHPPQHPPQHTFTPQYNPAHLRPMIHGNPQILPAHLVNAGGQAPVPAPDGQQQPQPQPGLHLYPAMYGYNMNYGQMQQAQQAQRFWQQGMGRGMPGLVNGQAVIPPAHAQQPPLVGKAGPAGIQGR